MTTIVYRDGILAADTQLTHAKDIQTLEHKIHTLGKKHAYAACGFLDDDLYFPKLVALVRANPTGDANRAEREVKIQKLRKRLAKAFGAIEVKGRRAFWWDQSTGPNPIPTEGFYVVGSGEKYARAGLHLGLDARNAVLLAGELSKYTNTLVDSLDIYNGYVLSLVDFTKEHRLK